MWNKTLRPKVQRAENSQGNLGEEQRHQVSGYYKATVIKYVLALGRQIDLGNRLGSPEADPHMQSPDL